MVISDLFNKGRSVLSFEIFPPKKGASLIASPEDAIKLDETLSALEELHPDYVSVTYGAGGFSRGGEQTVYVADRLKNHFNLEPLVHVTGIHSNKAEVAALLDKLADIGVNNVLALRGDKVADLEVGTDFPYADSLVKFIKQDGRFEISAACYPEGHMENDSLDDDIKNLKNKVDQGATHLLSQLFFDNDYFYDFQQRARKAGINVPIEAGIMPVVNKKQIKRMASIGGATIPLKFRRILERYGDNPIALRDAGIAYAVDQIVDLLAHDIKGIHLYTMNNPEIARKICDSIRNLIRVKI